MSLSELKSKAALIESEIALKQEQLKTVNAEIANLEWLPIEWDALESLLKEKFAGRSYRDCPAVSSVGGYHKTYCFITSEGKLQVGPYWNNDYFPRGHALKIHHAMKPWNAT